MQEDLKERFMKMVSDSTAVLNDDDMMEITKICKNAADREIAKVTEEYLIEQISGGECV